MVDSCGWLGPDGNDNGSETQESRDPIRSHFGLRMSSLTFLKEINRKTKPKSSSDNNNNTRTYKNHVLYNYRATAVKLKTTRSPLLRWLVQGARLVGGERHLKSQPCLV